MTKVAISAVDCDGNAISIGSYVKRVRNFDDFEGKVGQYYKVIGINSLLDISLDGLVSSYMPEYFKVNNSAITEGKEYRLAVFFKESPIVVACNSKESQEDFEESPGFVKWLTEWTEW